MALISYSTYFNDVKKYLKPLLKELALPLLVPVLVIMAVGMCCMSSISLGLDSHRSLVFLVFAIASFLKIVYMTFLLRIAYSVMQDKKVNYVFFLRDIFHRIIKSPFLLALVLVTPLIAFVAGMDKGGLAYLWSSNKLLFITILFAIFLSNFAQRAEKFWADEEASSVTLGKIFHYFVATFLDCIKWGFLFTVTIMIPYILMGIIVTNRAFVVSHMRSSQSLISPLYIDSATSLMSQFVSGFMSSGQYVALALGGVAFICLHFVVWSIAYLGSARIYLHYRAHYANKN